MKAYSKMTDFNNSNELPPGQLSFMMNLNNLWKLKKILNSKLHLEYFIIAVLKKQNLEDYNKNYFVAGDAFSISCNALAGHKILIVIKLELKKLDYMVLYISVHHY